MMEEKELRAVLAENIRKYRTRRGWNQLLLSEKIGISANYLSAVETGKGWVTPLTLVKIANILEIEVFELFKPLNKEDKAPNREDEKKRRFVNDLIAALETATAEIIRKTVTKASNEYL